MSHPQEVDRQKILAEYGKGFASQQQFLSFVDKLVAQTKERTLAEIAAQNDHKIVPLKGSVSPEHLSLFNMIIFS